jgi:hypothetical protein
MKLYEITPKDVEEVIKNPATEPAIERNRYVVSQVIGSKFKGKPLKVIYVIENDDPVILSAYPLKKSYWR